MLHVRRAPRPSNSRRDTGSRDGYREVRDFTAAEARWSGHGEDGDVASSLREARRVVDEVGIVLRLPAVEPPPAPPRAR